MYESGRDALAEQERHVSDLRSRGPALLAAGALIAGLLVKPAFVDSHPNGTAEWIAVIVGLAGAGGLLAFVVCLLSLYELGFSLDPTRTYRELFDRQVISQPLVDFTLAAALSERRSRNGAVVSKLRLWLALSLICLVVETCGLGLAAALA